MATTNKQRIRAARQDELREKLRAGGHLQQIAKNIKEIQELKPSDTAQFTVNKLKIATELQLRLVNKYLPDLKAMELTGEGGGPMQFEEWLEALE